MKKTILFASFMLLVSFYMEAQNQFRKDFNYVAFFDAETKTWSDWEQAEHTFVFNINDNQDIRHYTAKGEIIVYRNMGNKQVGDTKDGEHYQILDLLDDTGNELSLKLFDNPEIGVLLINAPYMVQFAKY
jgi:hypothetical protein